MGLTADVRTHAKNHPDLIEFGERIHVDTIPDGSPLPHVRLFLVDAASKWTTLAYSGQIAIIQADVYAVSSVEAERLGELFHRSFRGFKGQMGDTIVGRCFSRHHSGSSDPDSRRYWHIVELEIGTNG